MKKLFNFLKEARAELRKVTWPSWEDINRSTVVVFATVVVLTFFVYFADKAVSYVLDKVLG